MSTHTIEASRLLRFALAADGLVSLAAGVLSCGLLQLLLPVLGASFSHMLTVGMFMAAYGLALTVLSRNTRMDRRLVTGIVFGNAGWVLASLALLLTDWIEPTALGVALVVGQAVIVAALSALQYLGLRRSAGGATANINRAQLQTR
jgi:hypothetical protein